MPSKPNQFQPKIRLYIELPFREGVAVNMTKDQAHYLGNVMRQSEGDHLLIFNGVDGEWLGRIESLSRKGGSVLPLEQVRDQETRPDIWLVFAPIKRARFDMVVEKATELGVGKIAPVITRYTGHDRVRIDRMHAITLEAAEQCSGTSLPEIEEPVKLDHLLDHWPEDRPLYYCDERRGAKPFQTVLSDSQTDKGAILVGPEGGFSEEEHERLGKHPAAVPVTLGPRILRAETACLAALAIWQTAHGDWR